MALPCFSDGLKAQRSGAEQSTPEIYDVGWGGGLELRLVQRSLLFYFEERFGKPLVLRATGVRERERRTERF